MENVLFYKNPAKHFEEAFPIGNGHLGATVYFNPINDRISLNHDTLWTGTGKKNIPPENAPSVYKKVRELVLDGKVHEAQNALADGFLSTNSEKYMPLGNLELEFSHNDYNNYERQLNFENGIAQSKYSCDGAEFKREAFASYIDSIIAFYIEADEALLNFSLKFSTGLKLENQIFEKNVLSINGFAPPDGMAFDKKTEVYDYSMGNGMGFYSAAKVDTDGAISFENNRVTVKNAHKAVIYISCETDFYNIKNGETCDNRKKVIDTVYSLTLADYVAIKQRHTKDFENLYNRVNLTLSNISEKRDTYERLKNFDGSDLGLYELLFGFGRYLAISASREGSEATNLQGIWNEKILPPWNSNYTLNINTEMNYWPMLNTNLEECFGPYISFVEKLRESGKITAKNYYGARGFTAHHNADIWGLTNPVGIKNGVSAVRYSFWTMSTGWFASHLYELYEYTLDIDKLKQVFPIIYDAVLFYTDTLYKDENGMYMVSPTTSPENDYLYEQKTAYLTKSAAMSQEILKDLFIRFIRAAEILNVKDELVAKAKEILPKILPVSINDDETITEWSGGEKETDIHHRHVSHLYGLFPGNTITVDNTPDLANACRETLIKRGDVGTGWSLAWKVSLWAYLKDGDHALDILKRQLYLVEPTDHINYTDMGGTFPNLMDAHPPFQIDGNFGSTAAICNMLMQSEIGKIELLPALPSAWKTGRLSGVVAKGNVKIDIEWENNRLVSVALLSPVSQEIVLKANGKELTVALKSNEIKTISYEV